MAAVLQEPPGETLIRRDWLPVGAGLLLLYVPAFYDLALFHWRTDEGGHGPIILAVAAWLVWRRQEALFSVPARPAPAAGFALLALGLLAYIPGRAINIPFLDIGALLPILAGVLLVMRGWGALRALWFPILFLAFMVPLPGIFMDALTGPLKQHVSAIAEQVLYTAGYPVARTGVLIHVGRYQLLVADACAGLHSMFSLSALGLLFIYLTGRTSALHNAIMVASILPIAFAANVVRVLMLMLITYHFGDEAGQGFLHGATGVLLLVVALAGLIVLDGILVRLLPRR
ncbi:MAG TPA: exosortase B [Burkholderiales bacterium]|nr:exosortase B [Burkholderiales bacterium]